VNGIIGHIAQKFLSFTYPALSVSVRAIIGCSPLANIQSGASDMNNLKSILTALAMAGASLSAAAVAQNASGSMTVNFTGIEEEQGAVMGALFDSEAAYDGKGAPVRQMMVKADKREIAALFEGLAPGTYGIKVFHDIDGDMKMSTNPYGMPIEPFAFSNNAVGNMGPAKWADAKFEVKPGANVHSIIIK
jgi:uncharacterized protein (DUF2141 family)